MPMNKTAITHKKKSNSLHYKDALKPRKRSAKKVILKAL